MNDYDEFAATLRDAGWTEEEIEAAWQQHIQDGAGLFDTDLDPFALFEFV